MLLDSLDMYMWQMDGTKILNIRGITYILKVKISRNILLYIFIRFAEYVNLNDCKLKNTCIDLLLRFVILDKMTF